MTDSNGNYMTFDQWFISFEEELWIIYHAYCDDKGFVSPGLLFQDIYQRTVYAQKPKISPLTEVCE